MFLCLEEGVQDTHNRPLIDLQLLNACVDRVCEDHKDLVSTFFLSLISLPRSAAGRFPRLRRNEHQTPMEMCEQGEAKANT